LEKPWLKDFEEDVAKWRSRWESLYDEGYLQSMTMRGTRLSTGLTIGGQASAETLHTHGRYAV